MDRFKRLTLTTSLAVFFSVAINSCDGLFEEEDTFTPNHVIRLCNQTSGCTKQITYLGLHEEATNDGIGWYKFVSNPVSSSGCISASDFKEIEIEIPGTDSYDLVFKESKDSDTEIYWEDIALEEGGSTDVYIYYTSLSGGFYYGSAASLEATGSTLVCD